MHVNYYYYTEADKDVINDLLLAYPEMEQIVSHNIELLYPRMGV